MQDDDLPGAAAIRRRKLLGRVGGDIAGGLTATLLTLPGAMSLGIANKFLEPYTGAVLGKILILVLIILFIQRRPRGLFALKGRAVES